MTAIVIPIESEGSSFFNRRYTIVSPIPAKAASNKIITNIFETNLLKKYKNKKKFLGGGRTNIPYMDMAKFVHFRLILFYFCAQKNHRKTGGIKV